MGPERETEMSTGKDGTPLPADSLEPAKAVRLEDLVEYVERSVVSRTIAKTEGGTVTLFAFDKGQGLSEHSAPFDALVQVLDGRAELSIGDSVVTAAAGDAVLMPAKVPHAVRATERFKMLLLMLRG